MQTISKNRGLRHGAEQAARCPRGEKRQGEVRTRSATANGFLTHTFPSLFSHGATLPEQGQAERTFFDSAAILCQMYGFEISGVEAMPYPHNLLLAHHQLERQLKATGQDIDLQIIKGTKGLKLVTKCQYQTGTTLYYIPIIPLYQLLKDKKQKPTAELLLSICCYLQYVAGIPYYRDDHSELYYNYECMQGWFEQDMEGYDERFSDSTYQQLQQAFYYGDVMQRKLYNPCHLNDFQKRIARYKPYNALEYSVLNVAKKANALMEKYPHGRIFSNMRKQKFKEEEIIRAEQYISFIAKTEGTLYDQIAQMVNDEFNECGEMEIPTLKQIFDAKNAPDIQGLDFEYALFPLINELCEMLNNLP